MNDAVEFFGQAHDREGLLLIQKMSQKEGDFFLFSRAMELLQEECSPNNWSELGKNALGKGKYLFALKAFEKINDREGIAAARKNLGKIIKDEEAK